MQYPIRIALGCFPVRIFSYAVYVHCNDEKVILYPLNIDINLTANYVEEVKAIIEPEKAKILAATSQVPATDKGLTATALYS